MIKKNQGRERKLEIEEQPGESVAEDCVNWFDLPWESHCREKCRHSLNKNLSTTHFFFKRTSKVWLILVMKIEHGCSTKHNQNYNDHFRFDSYNISSHRTILRGMVMVCFSIQDLTSTDYKGTALIAMNAWDEFKLTFMDHIPVFLYDLNESFIYMSLIQRFRFSIHCTLATKK